MKISSISSCVYASTTPCLSCLFAKGVETRIKLKNKVLWHNVASHVGTWERQGQALLAHARGGRKDVCMVWQSIMAHAKAQRRRHAQFLLRKVRKQGKYRVTHRNGNRTKTKHRRMRTNVTKETVERCTSLCNHSLIVDGHQTESKQKAHELTAGLAGDGDKDT